MADYCVVFKVHYSQWCVVQLVNDFLVI